MIFEPKYTIGEIAPAADGSADTIRQWVKRGIITVGMGRGRIKDKKAELNGLAHRFTGATAIMIAIMLKLTRLGVSPDLAMQAARAFAHEGDSERDPGHLFPAGETMLAISGNRFEVFNAKPSTPLRNAPLYSSNAPMIILPLDSLVDEMRKNLRLDPDPRANTGGKVTGYANDR